MDLNLSPKERQLYSYLIEFVANNDRMPIVKELKYDLRLSSHGYIKNLLNKLVEKGYLTKTANGIPYRLTKLG